MKNTTTVKGRIFYSDNVATVIEDINKYIMMASREYEDARLVEIVNRQFDGPLVTDIYLYFQVGKKRA